MKQPAKRAISNSKEYIDEYWAMKISNFRATKTTLKCTPPIHTHDSHASKLMRAPIMKSFLYQVGNMRIKAMNAANIPIMIREKEPSNRLRTEKKRDIKRKRETKRE